MGYPEQITSSRQAAEDFCWIYGRLLTAPLQALRGHDNNPLDNNLSYHIGNSTLLKRSVMLISLGQEWPVRWMTVPLTCFTFTQFGWTILTEVLQSAAGTSTWTSAIVLLMDELPAVRWWQTTCQTDPGAKLIGIAYKQESAVQGTSTSFWYFDICFNRNTNLNIEVHYSCYRKLVRTQKAILVILYTPYLEENIILTLFMFAILQEDNILHLRILNLWLHLLKSNKRGKRKLFGVHIMEI